jgi:hypothetical protein
MDNNPTERTPAEQLREAAQMLRDTASDATRGPWVHHRTITRDDENDFAWTVCRTICDGGSGGCEPDCGADVLTTGAEGCEEDNVTEADASWIALVHPGLAEPLAAWLESAANRAPTEVTYRALAVARVLNGGAR